MKKMYLVTLMTGGYDSIGYNDLFLTEFEYQAKFYCSRGNAVLERYKSYYAEQHEVLLGDYDRTHPRHDDYVHVSNRNDFTQGLFSYTEIEVRNILRFNMRV